MSHTNPTEYALTRVTVGHMLIQELCPTLIGPTSAVSHFAVGHFGKKILYLLSAFYIAI